MSAPTGFDTLSDGIGDLQNYFSWVYKTIAPYLGARILEIGPGHGVVAQRLITEGKTYFAVDQDPRVIENLKQHLPVSSHDHLWTGEIEKVASTRPELVPTFDTLLSMNVLEHIEEDGRHLSALSATFNRARLVLFVPALPFLFGSMDQQAGHFRRYTRDGLKALLERHGYTVDRLFYFNALGVIPWWIVSRVLKWPLKGSSTTQMARLYDAVGIPLARILDPFLRQIAGQSLIAVASVSK